MGRRRGCLELVQADPAKVKETKQGKVKAARARILMSAAKKAISQGNARRKEKVKVKATAVEASLGSRRAREDISTKAGEKAAAGARAACTISAQDTMPHILLRSEPT